MDTPHLFYRATEANLLDTADPILLGGESNESQSDLHYDDDLDNNSIILVSKKRPLSADGRPSKRNCQRKGGQTSATLKGWPCNCEDRSIQKTPMLLSISLINGTFNAIMHDTGKSISPPKWARYIRNYGIVKRIGMIRVEEELGQHFYLVTGSYEPVCEQSALFNAEQAQSRFRPGCTSLLNAYALHLAKQPRVNVTQPRQLLALAESYITENCLTGSADPESTDSGSTDSESEPEWEVRKITGRKLQNGEPYYLVDWAPTWEPESELDGCRQSIDMFGEENRHQS